MWLEYNKEKGRRYIQRRIVAQSDFTEHVKDLDFILSVMGRYGRVFKQGGSKEYHEEATTVSK